jgi:hypothetical protein
VNSNIGPQIRWISLDDTEEITADYVNYPD